MDTYLPAIEKPQGLMMKFVYWMTKKQFGKVITPVKVFSARMPLSFGTLVGKIGKLDRKLMISPETVLLIRERVAHINVCLFCIDIGRALTIRSQMNQDKFDVLEEYKTSPFFTNAERAMLDYVTELTTYKKVNPETFKLLARYYSEREICDIVWVIATEHVYNISNIGLNIHSDMLCDIAKKKKSNS